MQVGLSPGSPPPDITVIQLQKPELLWLETQEIPSVGPSWKCLTPASCREHCREEGAAIWLQCLGQQISALLQIILPWDGFPSKSHLGWLQREMEGACSLSSGCLYSQEEGRCSSIWGQGRDVGPRMSVPCLAFTAMLVVT